MKAFTTRSWAELPRILVELNTYFRRSCLSPFDIVYCYELISYIVMIYSGYWKHNTATVNALFWISSTLPWFHNSQNQAIPTSVDLLWYSYSIHTNKILPSFHRFDHSWMTNNFRSYTNEYTPSNLWRSF